MRKLLLTSFMMMLGACMLFAQVTTSGINGKIVDSQGTPLPGASVIAIHTPSGTQYSVAADGSGNYRMLNMRPGGPYTVKVDMLGFQNMEYVGIQLGLADNMVLDASLAEEVFGLDAIVVSGTGMSSNMRSDRAGAVTNISTTQIELMPTTSRDLTDLTRLTPQANGSAIGGGTLRQNNITIDGASFNNKFGIGQSMPANGSPISMDAVDQISVSVTPYDVRQSGFLGASVNAVTRSGDNEFRGSVYTYYNNEKFKGNKVKSDKFDRTKNTDKMYGLRIGGPIVKNKLFFFFSYEKEDNTEPGPSRIAATADNPYGNANVAMATYDQMTTMRQYLIDTYGYDPGAFQGYSYKSPKEKFLVRLDWNINRNHRFNIRYSSTEAKTPYRPSQSYSGLDVSSYFGSGSRVANQAIWFQNAGYFSETNFYSVAAELNSTFGNVNNQFRISYNHQDEPRSTEGGQFPFVDILTPSGTSVLTSFGTELFSLGNLKDVKTLTITDDVSWTMGKHLLTAGLQYEFNHTKNGYQRFGAGYYTYASWDDFVNGAPALQFALTHSNSEDLSQAFPEFKFHQATVYAQDEMNLTNRFKLTVGLRLDLPIYPSINGYNPEITAINFGGKHYDTSKLPGEKVLFSPRVGFNYDILGDRSLVLRGGSGLFTGTIPFTWIVSQASDAGVVQTTVTRTGANVPAFHTTVRDMVDDVYNGSFVGGTPQLGSQATVMDKDLKLPQTWKTSIALDAKFGDGWMATIEGIVNWDVNSVVVENVGLKDEKIRINDYPDQRNIWAKTFHDSKLKNMYVLKNGGRGYYWSATAKLEKSFKNGFYAMIAYTHSLARSVNDGVGDQVSGAWSNAPTVNGSNTYVRSNASYVVPDRIVASVSYRKEYAGHFATSVALFYTGSRQGRYSYTYASNLNNDGGGRALLYVPKDDSEITFVDSGTYTADEQRKDFWDFVNNDKYLKHRKGKYAERNGALLPWVNTFDLKILQDFFVDVKGKRNTIQIGFDIMNVGNAINRHWGTRRTVDNPYPLDVTNVSAVASGNGNVKPEFIFMKDNQPHIRNVSYTSTYSMQLSLRYIFN